MPSQRFTLALSLTIFLFFLNHLAMQLPEVKPASAADNEFSGERAYLILENLLEENTPHPVGSIQNKIVKNRIIAELAKYGIEAQEQRTWACGYRYNSCAYVENITAIIPGKSKSPYVALMSHYDSVPMAPGAGDDGAGVAAMLEAARILQLEAPFESPILFIFTDAEEMGLIGAEGFYRHNELANDIGILLNFEGSGSTGLSQVLRTSGLNGNFIDAFQSESDYPRGASLINEIFKRMPNDTDFSVAQRANTPGIDFAFASERNHYHTPLDNLANIDQRTIQHHGENMLPLTRWLADHLNEATSSDISLVYSNNYGFWAQWSKGFSPILLSISLLLLGFSLWRLEGSFLGSLGGAFGAVLVIFFTALGGTIVFKLLSFFQGTTVSWPGNELGYRILLFSSTFGGGLTAAYLVNKYLTPINALIGAWLLWSVFSALLIVYMPDAANLLLLPLLAGSLVLAVSSFLSDKLRPNFLLLSLVLVIPATYGLVLILEESQGYRLIVSTFPFIALFMTIFTPLVTGSSLRVPILTALMLTIAGMGIALTSPLYTENRPQHVNINYFENLDSGTAHYQIQSNNPLQENLANVFKLETVETQLLPYFNVDHKNYTVAESSGFSGPRVEVIEIEQGDSLRHVSLKISSPRQAGRFQIITPSEAKLIEFSLDDVNFESKVLDIKAFKDIDIIRVNGVFSREFILKMTFETQGPVKATVMDSSTELPETASVLIKRRSPLASPVHQGDQAVLFRTIAL